jgi:hypothetical protein
MGLVLSGLEAVALILSFVLLSDFVEGSGAGGYTTVGRHSGDTRRLLHETTTERSAAVPTSSQYQ